MGAMEQNRTAAVYARISVTSDESTSITRQLEAARQYAASRGWQVTATFTDDGVSATRNKPSDRPGWQALMASGDQFDTVIIWRIDRLARRITDFWDAVKALTNQDRTLVSIQDNLDMGTTIGQIVAGVLAGFAQMEAETTSARVRDARRHLLKSGRLPGGAVPYGWRAIRNTDGEGYRLGHDPDRIQYVRGMVERLQRGESLYAVKQWLDTDGAPLPRTSQSNRAERGWSYSTLERLVRNPILAGMIAYNPGNQSRVRGDDVIRDDNGLPKVDEDIAIMPVHEWRAMVARLDSRDTPQSMPRALKSKTSALLSGLVWCGHCDARMHRGTSSGRPAYTCPKCHQTISKIDDHVIQQFLHQKGEWHRWSMMEEVYDGGAELLPEIEQRLSELSNALQATDDDTEADRLTAQMTQLRQLRREQRARKPHRELRPTRLERTFGEDWAAASTVSEQRAILDDALERIHIRRGRSGRGLDTSRFTFTWKMPESLGPIVPPSDEDLATWAEE